MRHFAMFILAFLPFRFYSCLFFHSKLHLGAMSSPEVNGMALFVINLQSTTWILTKGVEFV